MSSGASQPDGEEAQPLQQKNGRDREPSKGGGDGRADDSRPGLLQDFCGCLLHSLSWLIIIFTFPFSVCMCLKIVQEYERAIIFRLGRALPSAKGPGLFFIVPCTDQFIRVDLRTISFDIPPQEILTKDSVTVAVDAVVYYRISFPWISVINVENAPRSTQLLAQTTLRNILGTKTLSEILTDRDSISSMMQHVLDEGTDPWGVQVERVEIKDVRLPIQLQRAMAAEAEAAREARAKVIAADGEYRAAQGLRDASEVINQSSAALQLRYLQTLTAISAEKNSTIIFPLPIEILSSFGVEKGQHGAGHHHHHLDAESPVTSLHRHHDDGESQTPKTRKVVLEHDRERCV
jgi:erythrocyte band 7 integral membrane protein